MRILKIGSLAFVTGFSGAMMPGPLLALTIGQVTAAGFAAAMWLILGHALLELVLLLLLIMGLRVVLAQAKVRGFIGLIGGAALLYMGIDMLRSAATVEVGMQGALAVSNGQLVLAGAAVSLANPYFTGWWATVGVGQLAQMAPQNNREYLAFYLGHELSDFLWYAFVALMIVVATEFLQGAWYHWLVGLSGAAVTLLALWFLYSGILLTFGLWRPASPEAADRKIEE